MKSLFLFLSACCVFVSEIKSQKLWDGGGGDNRWDNAANWYPDGVPGPGEYVTLNNHFVTSDYKVVLPDRRVTTGKFIIKPTLSPLAVRLPFITLELPVTNRFSEAFKAVNCLHLYKGAIFLHKGGGIASQVARPPTDNFVTYGARWIHASLSSNTYLLDLDVTGGVFEFNVPASIYRIFPAAYSRPHNLVFNGEAAAARGMSIVYDLAESAEVVDSFYIKPGVTVRVVNGSSIRLWGGKFIVEGTAEFIETSPITASIQFMPSNTYHEYYLSNFGIVRDDFCTLEGSGTIIPNNQFSIEVYTNAWLRLKRPVNLGHILNKFTVKRNGFLETGNMTIGGTGHFIMQPATKMRVTSPDGIWRTLPYGNIQTSMRSFGDSCTFEYTGSGVQHTGDAIPDNINALVVNKPSGDLILTRSVYVRDSLKLIKGKINTSASALLTWSGNNNLFGTITNNYGNSYGWEQSFVNGPMAIKMKDAGQLCVFPVGKGNTFAPVVFQKQFGGSATYTVEYFPLTPDFVTAVASPLHHISSIEYWKIRAALPTITTANADDGYVHLTWRPSSRIGATFTERRDLRLAHFENGGAWLRWEPVSSPAPLSDASYGLAQFVTSVVTDFSPESFTLGSVSTNNPMTPIDIRPEVRLNSSAAGSANILSPNPVQSVLQVRIPDAISFEIINPAGQTIKKQINRAGNVANISLGGIPAGVYYLRVFRNTRQILYPFVKQ